MKDETIQSTQITCYKIIYLSYNTYYRITCFFLNETINFYNTLMILEWFYLKLFTSYNSNKNTHELLITANFFQKKNYKNDKLCPKYAK